MEPPAGLEPAIYRLEVCRLIHWATGAEMFASFKDLVSSAGFEPATVGILMIYSLTTTIPRSTN